MKKRLLLSQLKYIQLLLDRFNIVYSIVLCTPLAAQFQLFVAQCARIVLKDCCFNSYGEDE